MENRTVTEKVSEEIYLRKLASIMNSGGAKLVTGAGLLYGGVKARGVWKRHKIRKMQQQGMF